MKYKKGDKVKIAKKQRNDEHFAKDYLNKEYEIKRTSHKVWRFPGQGCLLKVELNTREKDREYRWVPSEDLIKTNGKIAKLRQQLNTK